MRLAALGIILGLATPALAHPAHHHGQARAPEVVVVRPLPPRPVHVVVGGERHRFERLLAQVRWQRSEWARNDLLIRATRVREFSTSQVIQLIEATPAGGQRLSALQILATRIADPRNREDILDSFYSRFDRRAAARILDLRERGEYRRYYRAS